jgi:hypothetical protein
MAATSRKASAQPKSDTASLMVSLFDGSRQPINDQKFLIRLFDGFQNKVFDDYKQGPSVLFNLPFHNNLQDNYTVLATADGYVDAGFTPVKLSTGVVASCDLMLLEDDAAFRFCKWEVLKASDPTSAAFISLSSSDADAEERYDDLLENKPAALASLLNLITAMKEIHLPSKTPLDYFKSILWDDSLAQDRFFGYADRAIVNQVRTAALSGEFAPEPNPALFHPDATSSFKQIQFGEANVQLTFHENSSVTIDGVECIKVEPDIDCYKDLGAHALLEVIPNAITHGLTDPRVIYVLRWIAGRHAGVPEFAPPYTISL